MLSFIYNKMPIKIPVIAEPVRFYSFNIKRRLIVFNLRSDRMAEKVLK